MGDRRHDWPRPTAPRSLGNCSDLGDRSNAWHWYEHRPHSRHWYENDVTRPHNSSFRRKPESRGEGWHQPHPNTSNDQVSFSYLGVPATAGMSDWYENGCFPPRPRESCRGDSRIALGGVVVPAHPGIPRTRHWYENDATQPQKCLNATAPALVSPAPNRHTSAPASSFSRKRESRGGVVGGTNDTQDTSTNQHSPIFIPWCAGGNRHVRLL